MSLITDNLASIKLLVIGDSHVGKTSLIRSYISGKFDTNHLSTIGLDYFKKTISLKNNKEVSLNLWDTAGQERFRSLTMNYLKRADGLLLCVSLENNEYIKQINYWLDKLQDVIDESEIKILIIGTKSDLVSENVSTIFTKEIEKVYKGKYTSVITSSKNSTGVELAFKTIANMIIQSKEELIDMDIQSKYSNNTTKIKNSIVKGKKRCC